MEIELIVKINGYHYSYGSARKITDVLAEAFEPLKTNTEPFMDYVAGGVCKKEVNKVVKLREDAAEIISTELTTLLVDLMKKHDTHDGYPV